MSGFQFLPEQKKRRGQLTGHTLLTEGNVSKRLLQSLLAPLFEGTVHASAGHQAVTRTITAPGSVCRGAAVSTEPMPSAVSQSRKQAPSSHPHPEEKLLNIWRTQTSGKLPLAIRSVLGTAFGLAPRRPCMPQLGAEGWGTRVFFC